MSSIVHPSPAAVREAVARALAEDIGALGDLTAGLLPPGARARIWDTRKTTPGLRALEKAAVRAGGGVNHRGSLSDFVLVKDNHLAGLTITEAVRRARMRWPGRAVEVECENLEQVHEAVAAGATMVLLDNMPPERVAEAVQVIRGRVTVEVSGGVTLDTVGA